MIEPGGLNLLMPMLGAIFHIVQLARVELGVSQAASHLLLGIDHLVNPDPSIVAPCTSVAARRDDERDSLALQQDGHHDTGLHV